MSSRFRLAQSESSHHHNITYEHIDTSPHAYLCDCCNLDRKKTFKSVSSPYEPGCHVIARCCWIIFRSYIPAPTEPIRELRLLGPCHARMEGLREWIKIMPSTLFCSLFHFSKRACGESSSNSMVPI